MEAIALQPSREAVLRAICGALTGGVFLATVFGHEEVLGEREVHRLGGLQFLIVKYVAGASTVFRRGTGFVKCHVLKFAFQAQASLLRVLIPPLFCSSAAAPAVAPTISRLAAMIARGQIAFLAVNTRGPGGVALVLVTFLAPTKPAEDGQCGEDGFCARLAFFDAAGGGGGGALELVHIVNNAEAATAQDLAHGNLRPLEARELLVPRQVGLLLHRLQLRLRPRAFVCVRVRGVALEMRTQQRGIRNLLVDDVPGSLQQHICRRVVHVLDDHRVRVACGFGVAHAASTDGARGVRGQRD
mmetsp:Transcript_17798/g.50435  ORF Transcript_17798/g.50435 Transcript_17798/m.50435 type:complete len:300 (-) Transcript_17798:130-1029(-)